MTDEEGLLAELRQAASPPPPVNFRPGVKFQGRTPSEIVTGPMPAMQESEFDDAVRAAGYPLPESMTLVLSEMQMTDNEAAWQRDPVDAGGGRKEGQGDAYTGPTKLWRYKFKVVPKSARHDEDIAVLMAEAKAVVPDLPVRESKGVTSKVINLSDFQWGKVDELGGSAETLRRSEAALATVVADLVENPVDEIVLVDPGDILEGTESAPNALGTNDLSTTEQVRVARRVFWRWIEALAPLAPTMKVISVPSNHCRVRRGKNALGDALDDWGIEILAQLQDIAAVNPDAYGHLEFIIPEAHQEHVLVELVGGQVLGVLHGHQASRPDGLPDLLKKNARGGIGQADIVVAGHFHHLRVIEFGCEQVLFIAPTMDNGSSWFQYSGERSAPGILTFRVDRAGWLGLDVYRPAP